MTNQLTFVALGDITTDAFIKLREGVRVEKEPTGKELCMRFGDKLEYDDVTVVPAVGNAGNAAVSAYRLGLAAALVTDIGDDQFGKDKLQALTDEGVDTTYVEVHEGMQSNYHYVLRFGPERTILIKHHEYPYAIPAFPTPPKWIYFSSVGEHGLQYHHDLAAYVKENDVKLAFQPGSFQISLGAEAIADVYKATELFFCNKEEAQRILKSDSADITELLAGVRELGPTIAVITDGPDGAYASDGTGVWKMPMYPDPAPPVDRTGAGDSFSSTVTAMLAEGMDLPEALRRGPINSMSVVQHIGAQKGLLTREQLEDYLAEAPADYTLEQLA